MFIGGGFFWFLMGVLFLFIAMAFRSFAEERGWHLNWWKGLLAVLWYGLFAFTLVSMGTLIGENEATAGLRLGLFGLFLSLVLGVGLWRLLAAKPSAA